MTNNTDLMSGFTPTRASALAAHKRFLPFAERYARTRNYSRQHQAGEPQDVSRLSPYITHRLVLEQEVARDVLDQFSFTGAEKYLQEICWRTYWKGWLQMRPELWQDYCTELDLLASQVESSKAYTNAINGNTGIECFDDWVNTLLSTGYLHNHVRMWFASIWVFTLKLPWSLGAGFFFKHLLDADAASNTLSWRWVAGLHTQGKHYLARASNIKKYTEGQYDPAGQLNESDSAFEAINTAIVKTYERQALSEIEPLVLSGRCGLLITSEDCSPEVSSLSKENFVAVAGGHCDSITKQTGWSEPVIDFKKAAISDALVRAAKAWQCDFTTLNSAQWQASFKHWVEKNALDTVVVMEAPVGPWNDRLTRLSIPPSVTLVNYRRPWDNTLWPYATAGFFKLKKQLSKNIPQLVGSTHA